MSSRLLRFALPVFVVGLALHNLVLAELWQAGLRGRGLDVVAAWKEALLAVALAAALWQARRLPLTTTADRLALVYAAFVVLYAVLPQSWLDGGATTKGILYALRHDLVPVAAYALGRLAAVSVADRRKLGWLALGVGVVLSLWGLVDVYLVPLQWWRDSGVPGWFKDQLSLDYGKGLSGLPENWVYNTGNEHNPIRRLVDVYLVPLQWWRDSGVPGWFKDQLSLDYGKGLSGLPENWVYNTGNENNPIRRLVATFLSPLATAYVLVVVLLFVASRRRIGRGAAVAGVVCFAGLLWTHTRAATLALALGLVLLGAAQRRALPVVIAAAAVAVSIGFFAAYSSIGPSTSYTQSELAYLRSNAHAHRGASGGDPFSAGDTSLASHWRNLRSGLHTVFHHPQGYGLGNAGTEAKRTGVPILAGESTYTQLGVELGVAGMLAFVAWCCSLLYGLWTRSAWLFAGFAAIAALALQSDVLGVHWLSYVLFGLVGAALASEEGAGRLGSEP